MGYWPKKLKRRRHSRNMRLVATMALLGFKVERNGLNGYRAFALVEPDGTCDIVSAGSPVAAVSTTAHKMGVE
jgi:hypothetical protein